MDQSSCVLLEALKQFIDNPATTSTPDGEEVNHEEELESMSQKSAARAKQLLTKLCKKKKAKKTVEPDVPSVPVVIPVTTTLPPYAAMVLSAHEARLEGDKLRISLQNIKAITKGRDYFSRDVVYAVDALKAILDLQGSLSVILQAGNVMELRDVLNTSMSVSSANANASANDQRVIEFTLGDMQVADGGELGGLLRDVQLFFGNLPIPHK